MPSDLRISDFIFDAANSLSRASQYAGQFGDKLYDAERVSQINAGSVEIDQAFNEYLKKSELSMFGDPENPNGLPKVMTLEEYSKERQQFTQQYLSELSKKYTNPDALKALTHYAAQKGLDLDGKVEQNYYKRKTGDLQIMDLTTSKSIAENDPPELALQKLSMLWDNNANFDRVSAFNMKQQAIKAVYARDQANLEAEISNISKQVQAGTMAVEDAEKAFTAGIDRGIKIGRIDPNGRQSMIDGFRNTVMESKALGGAIMAATSEDGFLKPDGMIAGYKAIEAMVLTPLQANAIKAKFRDEFVRGYAEETTAKNNADSTALNDLEQQIGKALKNGDMTTLANLERDLYSDKPTKSFYNPGNLSKAQAAASQAVAVQTKKNQDTIKAMAASTEDGQVNYATTYGQMQAMYEPSGSFVGDKNGLMSLEFSLSSDISKGVFSTKKGLEEAEGRLVKIRKAIADMEAAEDEQVQESQTANYQQLNGSLMKFEQDRAFFETDKDWEKLSKSFNDNVMSVFSSAQTMSLSSSDYQKVLGDATKHLNSYTTQLSKKQGEDRQAAVGAFNDLIYDSAESAADVVRRYADLGLKEDQTFYNAMSSLEQLNTNVAGYYTEGDENSMMSKDGFTKASDLINSALQKGRQFVREGVKTAAQNAEDAKEAAAEAAKKGKSREFSQLLGLMDRSEATPFDVIVDPKNKYANLPKGRVVTADFLKSWVLANWDSLDNPDSKYNLAASKVSSRSPVEAARSALESKLAPLLKEGKINADAYMNALNDFDGWALSAENGNPTADSLGKEIDAIMKGLSSKGKELVLGLGGSDRKFNREGLNQYWSLFNGGLYGNVGTNPQQRDALLQQSIITGGLFLGYSGDEKTTSDIFRKSGFRKVQVATGTTGKQLVEVTNAPVFEYKGKHYALVPSDYNKGSFSGELQLAMVDNNGIATPLEDQKSYSELKEAKNRAEASIGASLYTGGYSGAFDTAAMAKDAKLLQTLGLKSGASTEEIFKGIAMAYGEYASTVELGANAGRQQLERAQNKWNDVAQMVFGVGTDKYGYIKTKADGTPLTTMLMALKTRNVETMKDVRNKTKSIMKDIEALNKALQERGIQ